jgi:hypothetical protein
MAYDPSISTVKSIIIVIISPARLIAASNQAMVSPPRSLDLFYVINCLVFYSSDLTVASIARFANQNSFDF